MDVLDASIVLSHTHKRFVRLRAPFVQKENDDAPCTTKSKHREHRPFTHRVTPFGPPQGAVQQTADAVLRDAPQ